LSDMNAGDKKVLSDVKEYGWHVLSVFEDDEGPGFSYTIGLFHTFKHPEVLMMGLDTDFMSGILNNIGDDIRNGKRYEAGREYPEIVENYKCSFQRINERFYGEYLGTAVRFYKGKAFPALQCIYPDMSGRYPWDEGVNSALLEMQSVLTDKVMRDGAA
jgi:hypothetical protein